MQNHDAFHDQRLDDYRNPNYVEPGEQIKMNKTPSAVSSQVCFVINTITNTKHLCNECVQQYHVVL